jgi:hypothetical protein
MASTFKKAMRGLAGGLIAAGTIKEQKDLEAEEKRRYDEEAARKERELQIQEQDAKQRKEMNELKLRQERVLYRNKMLMQSYAESKGNAKAIGQALSNWSMNGTHYEYNKEKSVNGEVVYDLYTTKKKADGGLEMDPMTGEAKRERLPLTTGEARFKNMEDLDKHLIRSADPTYMMAMAMEEDLGEIRRKNAKNLMIDKLALDKEFRAEQEKTPEGQRFIEKHKAEIEHKQAQTGKLKAETNVIESGKGGKTPTSQVPVAHSKDIYGIQRPMTDAEKQIAVQNQDSLEKAGYKGITVQEARRVTELKSDTDNQQIIADALKEVQAGSMTRKEFRDLHKKYNVPKKMFNDMLDQMDEMEDIESEEAAAGEPGLGAKYMKAIEWVLNPVAAFTREKLSQKATKGVEGK